MSIVVLEGLDGVGKTTLYNKLVEENINPGSKFPSERVKDKINPITKRISKLLTINDNIIDSFKKIKPKDYIKNWKNLSDNCLIISDLYKEISILMMIDQSNYTRAPKNLNNRHIVQDRGMLSYFIYNICESEYYRELHNQLSDPNIIDTIEVFSDFYNYENNYCYIEMGTLGSSGKIKKLIKRLEHSALSNTCNTKVFIDKLWESVAIQFHLSIIKDKDIKYFILDLPMEYRKSRIGNEVVSYKKFFEEESKQNRLGIYMNTLIHNIPYIYDKYKFDIKVIYDDYGRIPLEEKAQEIQEILRSSDYEEEL